MLRGASGSNGAFSMRCSPRPIRRKAPRYAHDLYRGANPQGNVDLLYRALRTVSALVIEHGGDEEQAIGAPLLDAGEDQGESELRRKWALIRYW